MSGLVLSAFNVVSDELIEATEIKCLSYRFSANHKWQNQNLDLCSIASKPAL